MKNSPTWRSIVSRLFFVLVLLVPITLTTSRSGLVQASTPPVSVQQEDNPIDNSVPGEAIPVTGEPYTDMVRTPGNLDPTLPGPVRERPAEEVTDELVPEFEQVPNPDALIDLSLPENAGQTFLPGVEPAQIPLPQTASDPSLDQSLGVTVSEVNEQTPMGMLTGTTGNMDDFNRANGPLGGAWTDKVAGITIFNAFAQSVSGGSDSSLSIHNGIGVNEAMARISLVGSGYYQYTGFAFNYADGQNFIFIKIQDNNQDGMFDTGACYTGNNNLVGFGLGFFNLSGTFIEGTLHVTVNANRSVEIALTDLVGAGGGDQKYVCNGAPAVNGSQFGIASYGGGMLDNITVEAVDPKPFTSFSAQDGPLGSDWYVQAGSFEIKQQKALGRTAFANLATYNSLGANQIEADVSLSPGGGLQYAGLVLNYDEGINDLFMKVQDNNGDGNFELGACYIGNNGSDFGPGIFTLSYPFARAHMTVSVSNHRVVYITLDHINGGSGIQYYQCPGAPLAEGYGVGIASYNGGRVDNFQVIQDFRDNFNRANGPLGSNWSVAAGSYAIVSQKAKGTTGNALAIMNYTGGSRIEADVSLSPGVPSQYSALILDYGIGASNIFIKVQDNGTNGSFNTAGCYLGNNNGGSFGAGFFALSQPFTTAHMVVSVDVARVVTLVFTNIDGGSGTQAYVCGVAPAAEGALVGIGSFQGGLIDNVRVSRVFGLDSFNRPNGSLGPSWEMKNGVMGIVDQMALGLTYGSSRTVFKNVTGNRVEGNIANNPAGVLNYTAFLLNYGAGVQNLFIKFQDQESVPGFEWLGCYIGDNGSGGSFGLGFTQLAAPVMSAHVSIWVNSARTVTILLTRINGDTGMQLYTCAGAPPAEGNLVGIDSFYGARIDNVIASDYAPTLDAFLPTIIR